MQVTKRRHARRLFQQLGNRVRHRIKTETYGRIGQLGEMIADATASRVSDRINQDLDDIHADLEALSRFAQRPPWSDRIGTSLTELDGFSAAFLNYAESDRGYAAQARLRFEPFLRLSYRERRIDVLDVGQLTAEVPYAILALRQLARNSSILCLGGPPSFLPLLLASAGYSVTVDHDSTIQLPHPNLSLVDSRSQSIEPYAHRFQAVIVRPVPHVEAAEQWRVEGGLNLIMQVTREGSIFVFGIHGDAPSSDALGRWHLPMFGWDLVDASYARRVNRLAWETSDVPPPPGVEVITLFTFERRG